MTKQEEIREELEATIKLAVEGYAEHFGIVTPKMIARTILKNLHSQGVVIKADGELPKYYRYIKTEPLI